MLRSRLQEKEPLDSRSKYTINADVAVEYPDAHGIAYIGLSPKPRQVDRTVEVIDAHGYNLGIHLDLDSEGRLIGIELMTAKLLPPRT